LTCAALPQPAPPPFAAINAAVAQYFFKTTALARQSGGRREGGFGLSQKK
jgi:hypothetical protein